MRGASLLRSSYPFFLFAIIFNILSYIPIVTSQSSVLPSTQPSRVQQPISHPNRDDLLTPGGTFTIRWQPDPHFSNVTLEIWDKTSWGYSRDFGDLCYHWINPFCGTIVSHAPNTGSYEWHIPKPGSDFPRAERVFWIKMYVDDYLKPEINNKDPVLSYTQNFAFAPDPGQSVSVTWTLMGTGTPTPSPTLAGTVTVTVHDQPSKALGATSAAPIASGTGLSGRITGLPTAPAKQGSASRAGRAMPALLLLPQLLGLW
ncbi:uncharacterized protein BDR25DRAFT_370467 [Lindgomyces ingoldianus]|uniref:Uncharacterized protein n=1 Tax=Lindgomyces ingoldianus TaxID=673940 RepID=A0ACB6QUR5_9PLEO|nr:uncharacterized protein BDR25DRAFT_370467 [Lindgomyces ingoldianus]KAF2469822.1 hypothetical protein BDR25DRAFT_370467 [Lindgomyces ingoldianus]